MRTLCRDYVAPAACRHGPTGSILRVGESEDFARVAALFGRGGEVEPPRGTVGGVALPIALGAALAPARSRFAAPIGTWLPRRGVCSPRYLGALGSLGRCYARAEAHAAPLDETAPQKKPARPRSG